MAPEAEKKIPTHCSKALFVIMEKRNLFLLFQVVFVTGLHAQPDEKLKPLYGPVYGLSAGTHIGPELGYGLCFGARYHKGRTSSIWDRHVLIYLDGLVEFHFTDKFMVGPKLSNRYFFEIWDPEFNYWGTHFGADYIVYTDFERTCQVIRPSVGINYFIGVFQLSYGYNFMLDTDPGFTVNTHTVQLLFKPYIFLQMMRRAYEGK
jgi:hypothetical protein